MADRTGIEWTDATWNPVRGCSRVSAGCQHCYAERVAARFSGPGQPYEGLIHASTGGWNGQVKLVPEALDQPGRWRKPRRIFVNSMSDLFHESVPDEFIDRVFTEMRYAERHTFQVLTKRPERMLAYLSRFKPSPPKDGYITRDGHRAGSGPKDEFLAFPDNWPLPNVWLGVSVEDQAAADERIPLLLQCPAVVRWISAEPLLGRVDLTPFMFEGVPAGDVPGDWVPAHELETWLRAIHPHPIDWVVAGGESGPGARPMHPDWARSLRDQCAAAGVPFLFKQWGEWAPFSREMAETGSPAATRAGYAPTTCRTPNGLLQRIGKKLAGRLLDGALHDEYPEPQA